MPEDQGWSFADDTKPTKAEGWSFADVGTPPAYANPKPPKGLIGPREFSISDLKPAKSLTDLNVERGRNIGRAMQGMAEPGWDSKAKGVSEILRNVGAASAPLAIPLGIATLGPAAMARGLVVGGAAGYGTQKGMEALGASPGVSQLAGDVVGGITGGATSNPKVGPAIRAGVKAGGPDIAAGSAKAGVGYAVSQAVPGYGGYFIGARPMWRGMAQAGRGLEKGVAAARESWSPTPKANPSAVVDTALLDQIARSLGGKAFDKLTPEGQVTVQGIYSKMNGIAPDEAAMSQLPPQVRPPSNAAPQGMPPEVRPPANAAPQGGMPPEVQPSTIPFKNPQMPPEVFSAPARAAKVETLAKVLHEGGIPIEDVARMTPDQWKMAAQAARVNVPGKDGITVAQVLEEMRRLAGGDRAPSPELMNRLRQTGAMSAAQELQQSIQPKPLR